MCRIAGIYNPTSTNLSGEILLMRDSMRRGGPDDAGEFMHPELPLALGHRRLSFLDLSSAGHQPMKTPDGNLQIIYNGEIYNFQEIRKELIKLGYDFKTQSDTEVILFAYEQWNKKCFEKFNGMFALALWDEKNKEIILARDHAGIKPLYYYLSNDRFIFASEIRAFKALPYQWKTEELWKPLFLLFGHMPAPFSTLKDVKTLRKGEWMSIHLPSLNKETGSFYKDDYSVKIFNEEAALEAARDILPAAVKRHLISDAPIGLFLSGGIDSSLLTLLAGPVLKDNLKTLSIQFDEAEFSEEAYQQIVIDATKAKHKAFRVNQKDFEECFPDILEAMDQPSIDAVNTYFISMYAKQTGLKAVLSGLGSDELFGGYPSFNRFRQWQMLGYIPNFVTKTFGNSSNSRLAKLSFERFHPMLSLYLMNRGLFTVEKASEYTGISVKNITDALQQIAVPSNIDYTSVNSNAAMELNLYMKNQLLKDADYMGMWHSIEIRVPFLDKELIQAINSVAPAIKFRSNIPKSLLIESFSTLLPAEIWCRKKQGFTFPFAYWLKQSDELLPVTKDEKVIFSDFKNGKIHWSRYWAMKLAGSERFN
jgi:asparagine synthase (glutamine-hydrolysing)